MTPRKKKRPYFPLNPGCLIGILIILMVCFNTQITGLYNFLLYPKQPSFFIAHVTWKFGSHQQPPKVSQLTKSSKTVHLGILPPLDQYVSLLGHIQVTPKKMGGSVCQLVEGKKMISAIPGTESFIPKKMKDKSSNRNSLKRPGGFPCRVGQGGWIFF